MKFQVSLKFYKSSGYFAWKPTYIYDNIKLNFAYNEKCFSSVYRENQNKHFTFNEFFPKFLRFIR